MYDDILGKRDEINEEQLEIENIIGLDPKPKTESKPDPNPKPKFSPTTKPDPDPDTDIEEEEVDDMWDAKDLDDCDCDGPCEEDDCEKCDGSG